MYGLEKQKKGQKFQFDLELELKKGPEKVQRILKSTEDRMNEIKGVLREGKVDKKQLDEYGILLHGYAALQKVIKKVIKS